MTRMLRTTLALLLTTVAAGSMAGQGPTTHRLLATPDTVAYGYYWSEATPALRIKSGDIIDVDTLLTNSPIGLTRLGVPEDQVQSSLRAIVQGVTGDRRGPGGHILTGPVYVEGAMPGEPSRSRCCRSIWRSTTVTTGARATCARTATGRPAPA